jgi:hypothetical protein
MGNRLHVPSIVAAFGRHRTYWLLVTAAVFLVLGALMAPIPSAHIWSRLSIATGLVWFALASISAALGKEMRYRAVVVVLAALALVAAIDEILPDGYRSSAVLLVVAGIIVVLLPVVLVANRRPTKP